MSGKSDGHDRHDVDRDGDPRATDALAADLDAMERDEVHAQLRADLDALDVAYVAGTISSRAELRSRRQERLEAFVSGRSAAEAASANAGAHNDLLHAARSPAETDNG